MPYLYSMHTGSLLLADSNIGDQFLLKELVHQLDRSWHVHVVPNARMAIRYLNHLARVDYPALILMDYALPVRGALELIDRLMHDARYREIPKFVWSAIRLPENEEHFVDSGAHAFLMKPQKASEAKALVRGLLSGCKRR